MDVTNYSLKLVMDFLIEIYEKLACSAKDFFVLHPPEFNIDTQNHFPRPIIFGIPGFVQRDFLLPTIGTHY